MESFQPRTNSSTKVLSFKLTCSFTWMFLRTRLYERLEKPECNTSLESLILHMAQNKTTSMIAKCRVRETPACWSLDKPVWWKCWPKQLKEARAGFRRKSEGFTLTPSRYIYSEVEFISSCSARHINWDQKKWELHEDYINFFWIPLKTLYEQFISHIWSFTFVHSVSEVFPYGLKVRRF